MVRWIIVVATLLLPALASAQVNTLPSAPHLLVKGHAEGHYVPDRFSIYLKVDVTNMLPDKARRSVEGHMRKIFAALEKHGALRTQTHASSLQIRPSTEYRDGKSEFVGTKVTRTVEATFDSLNKLRGFIAQLPADKEVQVTSINVSRSDMGKISMDLRNRAIANSQQAAKRIAAAYGMRIKGIYSVSEVAPDFAYGIQAGSWGGQGDGAMSGSAIPAPPPPAPPAMEERGKLPGADLRAGTIDVEQSIYAVYLTAQ